MGWYNQVCRWRKKLYGVSGYVPTVRDSGLSAELQAEFPTTGNTECHFCKTKEHKALECDRKSVVDGDTVYPLAYLFKKGMVTKWGLPTKKAKEKKGL